jgi:hypothetical protein
MFVKFSRRSRSYSEKPNNRCRKAPREPHRTVIAQLVESYREDGKPKQRIIGHLGTCHEPIDKPRNRRWFHERCNKVLDSLDLSADARAKIAAQIAVRIPPLSAAELEADEARITAVIARFLPDGFSALVHAWNAANEDERQRFLDTLDQQGKAK